MVRIFESSPDLKILAAEPAGGSRVRGISPFRWKDEVKKYHDYAPCDMFKNFALMWIVARWMDLLASVLVPSVALLARR